MDDYKPTNREKSKRATKGKFWCSGCDSELVGQYGKCPNCGYRENKKKKKQSHAHSITVSTWL